MTVSAWTEDRVDRLKLLWREGQTADQIARLLAHGISRSAVLGKVHRLGPSKGRPPKATRPAAGAAARDRPAGDDASRRVAGRPPPLVGSEPGAEDPGVSLLAIGRRQCRWPLGEPGGAGFDLCGRTVSRGAYCAFHAGIAYRPARETAQALERLACLS